MAKTVQVDLSRFYEKVEEVKPVEIDNFFWKLYAEESERKPIYRVVCSPTSNLEKWTCNARVKIGIPKKSIQKGRTEQHIHNLVFSDTQQESKIILMNDEKHFAEYEMIVEVKTDDDIRQELFARFSTPIENITDARLKIGDKTLHVCKKILAHDFPYFYNMFYGDDSENDTNTYYIDNLTKEDFFLLLQALSDDLWLSVENIGNFINLSRRFHLYNCIQQCWKFAKDSMKPGLKDRCVTVVNELSRVWKNCNYVEKRWTIKTFAECCPNLTDVALSIGDRKFHVSKQILANALPYFYSLFYPKYSKNNQTEVPLLYVDADDFEELLRHVYHPKRIIRADTIGSLTQLAMIYDAPRLFQNKNVQFFTHNKASLYFYDPSRYEEYNNDDDY